MNQQLADDLQAVHDRIKLAGLHRWGYASSRRKEDADTCAVCTLGAMRWRVTGRATLSPTHAARRRFLALVGAVREELSLEDFRNVADWSDTAPEPEVLATILRVRDKALA